MADATTAAKDRIDRAMATLERKVLELKARAAGVSRDDDDLFAAHPSDIHHDARAEDRIAALEAAGRDASAALARAADGIRAALASEPDVVAEDEAG